MSGRLRFHDALRRSAGFTLVELMVGITLGLLVLAIVTTVFVNVSSSRREVERTGRQIENGRFAMQLLADDIINAGYFGEFDPSPRGENIVPPSKPDPCSTNTADMKSMLMMHLQGYPPGAASPACINDVRAETPVIVVRRTATCVAGGANCDPATAGTVYLQSSLCNSELSAPGAANHYAVAQNPAGGASPFVYTQHDCNTAAALRAYVMHVYFIANNNNAGDGIPTLKRAELNANGQFEVIPLVEGIENIRFEYGLDNLDAGGAPGSDGVPDVVTTDPGTYNGCAADPCYIANWENVVTVTIRLLSRALDKTPGYTDTKTYPLEPPPAVCDPAVCGPFNDGYKRHAYTGTVRVNNAAQRREP